MTRWWCAALLCAACAEVPPPEPPAVERRPEPPSILRDVSMIADDLAWNHPFVPGHRTTQDGRVALRVQGGPPGDEVLRTSLSFSLFVPERLEAPILPGPPGAQILADPTPVDVVFPPALAPGVVVLGHHAICDATTEFPRPGERPNPQPCAHASAHDCYAITIVSTTSDGSSAQLWGTPATVEVADPKTARARIVDVVLGEPIAGHAIPATREWTEPNVTSDGRLLTGRLGRAPRRWTHPETGEEFVRPYDLAYAVLPPDAAPCDVTEWTAFHPMSHAPFDPAMQGYGLAAYPFRDSEGQPIPDGEDMGGTYPWVDREGTNVFMTAVHGRVVEQSHERFPRRCVNEGCERYTETNDWDRGFMVAGLWTHGKLVLLDGLINNQDWAVGVSPDAHWWIDLYRGADGAMTPVRFGAGRFIDEQRGGPDHPPGYTHNANILDSLQNLPNFLAVARPVTPRDVVWIMSSGVATDEIAFDDLLDPRALIVSSMQASITQLYDRRGRSTSVPHHHNGQARELDVVVPFLSPPLDPEGHEEIHLQNGATSLAIQVPPYGLVEAGTGRVEPVALGGVHGRGFWLDGDNRVTYALPAQDLDASDAYVGVFVDARPGDEDASRALLTFGDGSEIRLARGRVEHLADGAVIHEVALPESHAWVHLGWRITGAHRVVTLLVDGYALDRFEAPRPVLGLSGGALVVGRARDGDLGARGWIDDLVVLAHDVDPEVACNHAAGTLVRVDGDAAWSAVAARHPSWAHDEVAAAAGEPTGARFACFHDYARDYGAHLQNAPAGTTPMRAAIHFPEGPLRAGAPRPDSSRNAFCLSCHHAEGRGPLGLAALEPRPGVLAEDDPRRQPSQPPRRVFGNVPAGWLAGAPAEATQAPPEGLVIDAWVLPRAE